MKWMQRILIAVAILVLLSMGSFVLYSTAYSRGETAGYENGYSIGETLGYSSGKKDGYSEGETAGYIAGEATGYIAGEADGYSEGETAGYLSGKQDGYTTGRAEGYDSGYDEGMEAGLGHGYTLRDPTYAEAITFLGQDETDNNEYIMGTYGVYVCSHYARDVCNNAEEEGLRCAFVELRYSENGHSIIAFETSDKGLVYFEPQTDEITKPVIGKWYYQCIEPKPGYKYERPPFDDTIMDILVIW